MKAFLLASALNGGVSISCPGMLDFAGIRKVGLFDHAQDCGVTTSLYNNYT